MDITVCTYKLGGIVEKIKKLFSCKYAVIRRDDLSVIVEMDYFPENPKSMMYRNGRKAIFLPMRVSDIMGNDKLLDELRVRASC
ncbi:TPA: hypothetical protein HJR51_000996 [Escherichia coli]|nr:hypothetical protein [Escherichia coli]EFN7205804.1 hypothetical protein [Escherichia coli H1]EFN7225345.1 hypothetical protein [Escherichia coli O6]EFD0757403.1 hypothetical protein [Escherichia coli]EFK4139175.1 hypothetical protein [Escherichia coli]